MTKEEILQRISAAAATVKLCCGVANNAAWMAALEAHDHIKAHRNYKRAVRGGQTIRSYYKKAIFEFHKYERRLIYADQNRMFHVADMTPEVRKKYGNITDREYYEFWAAIGFTAYQRTRPMVTSLWNKYRLSLAQHGIEQPDIVAWAMTGQACLALAVKVCDTAITSACDGKILTERVGRHIFGQFSLKDVAKLWMDALKATDPKTDTYTLTDVEERNIRVGLEQLEEAWTNPSMLYGSTIGAAEAYDEIFRTQGELKKACKDIEQAKQETEKELR